MLTIASGDIPICNWSLLLLFALTLLVPQTAQAQFPSPPNQTKCKSLVERVATEAAGQIPAADRQRIEDYIVSLGKPQPQLHNHAGVALLVQGYPNESIWCLAKAVETNFDQPEVLNNIGLALTLLKKYNRAETVLLYITHKWPEFSGAWVNLARLYLDQRDNRRAEEAVARARKAEPGNLPAEEAAGRMAIQGRDQRAAARRAVNISSLDPGNPWVAPLTEVAGDSNIEREISGRLRSIPMPRYSIDLNHPINSNYEAFASEEIDKPFWGPAFRLFAGQATNSNRQSIPLTPETSAQLPPGFLEALSQIRGGAGSVPGGGNTHVLAPSASRAEYLLLAKRLDAYSIRYRGHLKRLFKGSRLDQYLQDEFQRQRQFYRDYGVEVKGGADNQAALNRYVRRSLNSLEGRHGEWLEMVRDARRQQNQHLRRFWMSTAALLSMVPDAHLNLEIHFLRQQAAMSNEYYLGHVFRWAQMGIRPIGMDRMLAKTAPQALHLAAENRELEAMIAREQAEEEWEEELESDEDLFDEVEWLGLNLGAFAVKVEDDQFEVTVGEVLQGSYSFNWEDYELELAVGPGLATPSLHGFTAGFSGKVHGVMRLGGPSGAALGVREQVKVTFGTPVYGRDLVLHDHYTTLISAGAPMD